jgi:predicted RNA binding protein YcfA (HicA-like mRNA interferase family)
VTNLKISGKNLIKLAVKDGWEIKHRATHGISLSKKYPDKTRVIVIPDKEALLPDGTLAAILGPKQMGIGRKGLEELIKKYGY